MAVNGADSFLFVADSLGKLQDCNQVLPVSSTCSVVANVADSLRKLALLSTEVHRILAMPCVYVCAYIRTYVSVDAHGLA